MASNNSPATSSRFIGSYLNNNMLGKETGFIILFSMNCIHKNIDYGILLLSYPNILLLISKRKRLRERILSLQNAFT